MPKKYKQGKEVRSILEAVRLISKGKPMYFRHKFMASGFLRQWRIAQLEKAIKCETLFRAEKINETKYRDFKAKAIEFIRGYNGL